MLQAYHEALDSHDSPIVVLDTDGTIRFANRSACRIAHAKSSDELEGLFVGSAGFIWHADRASLANRLAHGEYVTYFELNGRSYACEAMPVLNRLNEQIGLLECIRTEGDWVYDEGVDALTGIAGKHRFLAETRRLLDCNPGTRYAIVYWGVNRFKLVNDVFSTATGDRVLKSIAETISSFVGDEGTCGHFGGDCFVLCTPCERLSADWFKLHSEVTLMSDTAMYTFKSTYGVYEIDDLSCSVETMCERAAYARASISKAQTAEGDCYAFYDDAMHEGISQDLELVAQLSYALASNQIKAYYQPIYNLSTGQIASAEALARWEHPEKGIIFPGRFIPLFESNGMITELDKHLWDQVGSFLERRLNAHDCVVPMSINVSRIDFFATTLMDDFDDIVGEHDLPREFLRIEVTETAYTDDPKRIIDIISALHERGHTVLLDDFGSGYSSLNTLKDMPIHILKLDMSFLRDLETDERTRHIIGHIVAMAHDLGLKVVAEGVETEKQVDYLRTVNCDFAQGFFYARPMSEECFVKKLDEMANRESCA